MKYIVLYKNDSKNFIFMEEDHETMESAWDEVRAWYKKGYEDPPISIISVDEKGFVDCKETERSIINRMDDERLDEERHKDNWENPFDYSVGGTRAGL